MNPLANPVDIRPDHLEIVQGILREYLPEGVKVWVFGSRANWTTKDSSDLDLALEGENALTHKLLGVLKDAFDDSTLPYTVDVVDVRRISESFRPIVESQRVPLPQEGNDTGQPMPNGWCEVTLGELGEVDRGRSRHRPRNAPELYGGPYPFVQTGDIKASGGRITLHSQTYSEIGLSQSRMWPAGTMAITIAANIAETAILTYPACFPDSVVGFVADDSKCDVRFIEYLFRILRANIQHENVGTGSVQDNINLQTLSRLRFSIPPLSEQRAIAHVLGTLDDKIELNRRMNETLEAMARALFKSWFVDFDPVRAKMEGRWRPGESLPGLPAHLYDLFPDLLVDSALGEIPEGWEVKALGDVVELNPRETLRKGTMAPYLDMAALPTSGPNSDEPVLRAFSSGTRFRNGDTLLARITPCLENGKTAFIQALSKDIVGWGSTEFIVMRPIQPVPAEYGYLLARHPAFREHAVQSMTGTSGRQRVQVDALAPYPLPNPPSGTWLAFGSFTAGLLDRADENRREIAVLSAQRDALLPRLVSGEAGEGMEIRLPISQDRIEK